MPRLSNIGNEMNRANDGITSHNISVVNEAIFSVSAVSLYNQIIAAIETKGSEAISAPNMSFFFATSLAPTINPPEINPLIANCHQIMKRCNHRGFVFLLHN